MAHLFVLHHGRICPYFLHIWQNICFFSALEIITQLLTGTFQSLFLGWPFEEFFFKSYLTYYLTYKILHALQLCPAASLYTIMWQLLTNIRLKLLCDFLQKIFISSGFSYFCLSNIRHKDIRPTSVLLRNAHGTPPGFWFGVDWRALVED